MIKQTINAGKSFSKILWTLAKSEKTLAMLKILATIAAFVHSVEEYRKIEKPLGFKYYK
jgi:hypothetical protein